MEELLEIERDPTPGERVLYDAYRRGIPANLTELAHQERFVRWRLLHWIAFQAEPAIRGLRVTGAIFPDFLDWKNLTYKSQLSFWDCEFQKRIDLSDSSLGNVTFSGGVIHSLRMSRTDVEGRLIFRRMRFGAHSEPPADGENPQEKGDTGFRLDLEELVVSGKVELTSIEVIGNIKRADSSPGHAASPTCSAVDLSRATIGGDIIVRSASLHGEFRLVGAQAGKNFVLQDAKFWDGADPVFRTSPCSCLLNADGVRVDRNFVVKHVSFERTTATVLGLFRWITIGGNVEITSCKVGRVARSRFFDLKEATIHGSLSIEDFFGEEIDTEKSIRGFDLDGIRVGENLTFQNVTVSNATYAAIQLKNARIARDVWFNHLRCLAQLDNAGSHHHAVDATDSQVGGELIVGSTCKFIGQFSFESAFVGRGVDFRGGDFLREGRRAAVVLDGLVTNGNVQFCADRGTASGSSYQTKISGGLSAMQLRATNLLFRKVTLKRGDKDKSIDLSSVRIGDQLDLSGLAIDGDGAPISLSLQDSSCQLLVIGSMGFPATANDRAQSTGFHHIELDRMRFETVQTNTSTNIKVLLGFINRETSPRFNPQPHRNMAAALQRSGRTQDAALILRDLERRRRRDGQISFAAWPIHFAYGLFAGYGFSLARAALTLCLLIAALSGLAELAWREGAFVPRDPEISDSASWRECAQVGPANATQCWLRSDQPLARGYQGFNPVVYSFDVVAPVVEFGQERRWDVAPSKRSFGKLLPLNQWPAPVGQGRVTLSMFSFGFLLELLLPYFTISGWILTAFIAAGLTRSRSDP